MILLLSLIMLVTLIVLSGCTQRAAEQPPAGEPDSNNKIDDFIILATTTSTYDSGLLDFINPVFTEKTGLEVRVVSQGTGAALQTGARGDADVLLVHDRAAELRLVEEGAFVDRYDCMYNDFIFVGPAADPAGVMKVDSVAEALNLIANGGFNFLSRGDDSGTHRMEKRLWDNASLNPQGQNWYLSVGQGMGDTLNMTSEKQGYSMTDRATYVAMKNNLDLVIVLEGDSVLFNQYGVMAVNEKKHSHVKHEYALMYIEFLMSEEGQDLISSYQINGETLFFPGYGLK